MAPEELDVTKQRRVSGGGREPQRGQSGPKSWVRSMKSAECRPSVAWRRRSDQDDPEQAPATTGGSARV